jgi:anti-anti-sigma factor
MTITTGDLSELVRGHDQWLLERVTPILRHQNVILDLASVERIDAAGIAALISLYGSARDSGHRFGISRVSERVAHILSLVGLDRILLSQNAVQKSHSDPCVEWPAA